MTTEAMTPAPFTDEELADFAAKWTGPLAPPGTQPSDDIRRLLATMEARRPGGVRRRSSRSAEEAWDRFIVAFDNATMMATEAQRAHLYNAVLDLRGADHPPR